MDKQLAATIYAAVRSLNPTSAKLLTPSWTAGDFSALRGVAARNQMSPYDLLAVITSESHTLEPSARNPSNRNEWPLAVGLNQLTRTAASAAGLIPSGENLDAWKEFADKMVEMRPSEQMGPIDAYYQASNLSKANKPWPNAATIYAYNAASGSEGSGISDATVIYPKGSSGYEGNKALDVNGDGQVTGKDLRLAVEYHMGTPLYRAAALRMGLSDLSSGYLKGWQDGQGRYPADATSPSGADPNMYAAAYDEGYLFGSQMQYGAEMPKPPYLT